MVASRELLTSDFPGVPGHSARGACRFPGPGPGAVTAHPPSEEHTVTDALPAQTEAVPATATAPKAAPSPAPSPSPETVIAEGRRHIDDLDARIIELVRERMDRSADVQRARIESGGRRLHLAREMEILRGYGDVLGKPGTALAMTLLELCRGRV